MEGDLPDIEEGYRWALEHNWHNICKQWIELFDKAQPKIVPSAKKTNGKIDEVPPELMSQLNRAERRRIERDQKKAAKREHAAR
jgi:hypothetical protein